MTKQPSPYDPDATTVRLCVAGDTSSFPSPREARKTFTENNHETISSSINGRVTDCLKSGFWSVCCMPKGDDFFGPVSVCFREELRGGNVALVADVVGMNFIEDDTDDFRERNAASVSFVTGAVRRYASTFTRK